MHKLETEEFVALPERLETSDYNLSALYLTQSNLGIQIGGASFQGMLQANVASVHVTQVN